MGESKEGVPDRRLRPVEAYLVERQYVLRKGINELEAGLRQPDALRDILSSSPASRLVVEAKDLPATQDLGYLPPLVRALKSEGLALVREQLDQAKQALTVSRERLETALAREDGGDAEDVRWKRRFRAARSFLVAEFNVFFWQRAVDVPHDEDDD